MLVVAMVNQKGGVGKTTVALGLAAMAGRRGLRTVLVDLDPQANATSGMGVWDAALTIDSALAAESSGSASAAIVESGWDAGLFADRPRLVPSSPQLAQRETQLATDPIGAQDRLAIALEGIDADLVLIDCPPSLGLLTVNALFAADKVVIVTEPGAWATDGVEQILRNVRRIADRRHGELGIAGIVVNRLARTRDARYWESQLIEAHPDLVIEPSIRLRAAVAEASAAGVPLHALERDGTAEAVAEFDAVLDRILGIEPVVDHVVDHAAEHVAELSEREMEVAHGEL